MEKILWIDACVRGPQSRTRKLTERFLGEYRRLHADSVLQHCALAELDIRPLNEKTLAQRDACLAAGDLGQPIFRLAAQFAEADTIVISAPFWDLNFPSVLKVYFEQICVCGLTFHYNERGEICGDCAAGKLLYVTTRGGIFSEGPAAGFELAMPYIRGLCGMFGIPKLECLAAEGLDIITNDAERLMEAAFAEAERLAAVF